MPPVRPAAIPQSTATAGAADAGSQKRLSSVGKESRNFVGRNRPFADDAPASPFVGQVNNGGRNVTRGNPAVHDNADAALELVADLLGAGTLRSSAQIRRGSRD